MRVDLILRRSLLHFNRVLRPINEWFSVQPESPFPPPLFIIGPPRSGTTLTYQVIAQYFKVGYITAPMSYAHGIINPLTRLLRPWLERPAAVFESEYGNIPGMFAPGEHAHYWFQWFPDDGELGNYVDPVTVNPEAYADLRSSLASLTAILDRPLVFKNLYLSMTAGALAKILPDAHFLLVKRDPLLVCQSILLARQRQADPRRWWSVKPPHYRDWLDLPLWQQVTRQIFHAEAIPCRDLHRYAPARLFEMEYAELCRQPAKCLEDLKAWLKPLGYESYPDSRIPPAFSVSESLTLTPETVHDISTELATLRQQFHA